MHRLLDDSMATNSFNSSETIEDGEEETAEDEEAEADAEAEAEADDDDDVDEEDDDETDDVEVLLLLVFPWLATLLFALPLEDIEDWTFFKSFEALLESNGKADAFCNIGNTTPPEAVKSLKLYNNCRNWGLWNKVWNNVFK